MKRKHLCAGVCGRECVYDGVCVRINVCILSIMAICSTDKGILSSATTTTTTTKQQQLSNNNNYRTTTTTNKQRQQNCSKNIIKNRKHAKSITHTHKENNKIDNI